MHCFQFTVCSEALTCWHFSRDEITENTETFVSFWRWMSVTNSVWFSSPFLGSRLTALVLKTFSQAQDFIHIDEQNIKDAASALIKSQTPSGCFKSVGKLFNNGLMVWHTLVVYWIPQGCFIFWPNVGAKNKWTLLQEGGSDVLKVTLEWQSGLCLVMVAFLLFPW